LEGTVNKAISEVNEHRDVIQSKYDNKLRKIKEVCANYFGEYEKELKSLGNKFSDLDGRCEEWARLLV